MGWYKRDKDGITTSTSQKKETPDGIWHQCGACKTTSTVKDLVENLYVCPACDQHERIGSQEYFEIIFDKQKYKELFTDIIAHDFLEFTDLKPYQERLEAARKKTELDSAMRVAKGKVNKLDFVIASMDFGFIGGSMGSVMGEKISKAIDYCIEHKMPLMIISKSGGARMMESAFSLMQMAKISAKLTLLAEAKIPYLSFLTDPTTGGVSASFAMLGDFNFSEPNALIAFAGPRIVKETLKLKELPEGFQRSEYLLENGFLDFIVARKDLQERIGDLLYILKK
ncbi:MAG: acetyl-CoA carboxylase, carboxyltransferase subunit beta [Aureispira sp.]